MYLPAFRSNADINYCSGSASSVDAGELLTFDYDSLNSHHFSIIADSGATSHMFPDRSMFRSYCPTPGSYVILANKQRVSNPGCGDVHLKMGQHTVILTNVLHVPSLRMPLYSIRAHRRSLGCSFLADNNGMYLSFPDFFLPVDDRQDCLIHCSKATLNDHVSFHERHAGKVSAVSDNTRNRKSRRGIVSSSPLPMGGVAPVTENCQLVGGDSIISPIISSPIIVEDVSDEEELPVDTSYSGPVIKMFHESDSVLPIVPDTQSITSDSSSEASSSPDTMNISDLLGELNIDHDPTSTTPLSPKQIHQIAAACVKSLQENGCVTVSLLNWMREQNFLPSLHSKPTTTTPSDRPSLLCSDKMPSSTARRRRVTVPQLHRYMGFRKPRDWKEIIELSQETVTLAADDGDTPLELGDVANVKRSRRKKLRLLVLQNFYPLSTWT